MRTFVGWVETKPLVKGQWTPSPLMACDSTELVAGRQGRGNLAFYEVIEFEYNICQNNTKKRDDIY
jgi:hypothetical protein